MKNPRRLTAIVSALVVFCFLAYHIPGPNISRLVPRPILHHETPQVVDADAKQRQIAESGLHPIWYLLKQSQREFEAVKNRQSRTLLDAVREYRRRYGIPQPPHFDKWYDFARSNDVQLIDEFDIVHDQLMPFWGLKPETIRARLKEALSHDNNLLDITIRNGKASYTQQQNWIRNSTLEMMDRFTQHLPDMDLAVNALDEPRVVVPSDDLTRLLHKAKTENMAASKANKNPTNGFTPSPPSDLINVDEFERTNLTRFNSFPWQATWTVSRLSCPPDSPARSLDDGDQVDHVKKYRVSEPGFVYNFTAMSDICISPSLRLRHGFFDGPDSYSVIQELLPVFSQAKVSSYNDILYPLPYYWLPIVNYDANDDKPWAEKEAKLYWRGSTTGGHLINGNWRRHHRERMVTKVNAGSEALIMAKRRGQWEATKVPQSDYRELFDVHFTKVSQCEPRDCLEAMQVYGLADRDEQKGAWGYKYLLDLDGNSFSGRFYAFLRSKSLTFKQTLFREWHSEWLKPWVHYVPLSQEGDDLLEAVRFFDQDGPDYGKEEGERIATTSRDWANTALRRKDMEVWFFRLLLEYARVIDDRRESLGFDPYSTGEDRDSA